MAITLTDSEQATVEALMLSEDLLPTYYNSQQQLNVTISRDFEAFLILTPNELKITAISWISNVLGLQQKNKLRDDLTQRSTKQESSNALIRLQEFDKVLNNFNEFRTNFTTAVSTDFSGVEEVQLFLSDLQRGIEEISVARERAYFDWTCAGVLSNYENSISISDNQIEELQSWTPVLSAYSRQS